jgi:hypothetical protein
MSVFGGMSKGEGNRVEIRVRTEVDAQAQIEGRFRGGRPTAAPSSPSTPPRTRSATPKRSTSAKTSSSRTSTTGCPASSTPLPSTQPSRSTGPTPGKNQFSPKPGAAAGRLVVNGGEQGCVAADQCRMLKAQQRAVSARQPLPDPVPSPGTGYEGADRPPQSVPPHTHGRRTQSAQTALSSHTERTAASGSYADRS